MVKKDIKNIGDIAQRILEGVQDPSALSGNPDSLYNKLGQNLRLNDFKDGDKGIVMFYTMKPSDTENDKLHNASGPAVIFANEQGVYDKNDESNVYYFLNGEQVDPNSPEYLTANRQASAGAMKDLGDIGDTLGTAEDYGF